MSTKLFHYMVEGRGPKPFVQILVVSASSDADARAAARGYLAADGARFVRIDEEETAIIDETAIPRAWLRPGNDYGVVATSGRIWSDDEN